MPLNLEKVHNYKRIPGTMQVQLVSLHPAVRVKAGGNPPYFIQDGNIYAEGGDKMDREKLPYWFWEEASRMSNAALEECGLERAEIESHLQAAPSPSTPAAPVPVTAAPKVVVKK